MFTLVIDGRAIAVTDATPEAEARELLESLADEMIELESEGRQVWDGESPIEVRASTEEEIEAFDEAEMDEDADEEEDDEPIVMFLIPIDGLEEDDEDED